MKPRFEWGPADEAVNAFSTTSLILIACLLIGVGTYAGVQAIYDKSAELFTRKEMNKRGYVRCDDRGRMSIGNIDFEGEIDKPIINLDACHKPSGSK